MGKCLIVLKYFGGLGLAQNYITKEIVHVIKIKKWKITHSRVKAHIQCIQQ